ncbi:MAG TPA: hypothetical protein VKW78_13640 [Terriglobales bacterium]|nr:hypothetical protein [Terriglobales bacterium]
MRKLLALAFACCFVASFAFAAESSMTGWVSDEKCAAHAGPGKEECAKKCIESGSPMVFVNDKDKKILKVDNPDALKDHIGHHVNVKGSVNNGTVHVDAVEMASK